VEGSEKLEVAVGHRDGSRSSVDASSHGLRIGLLNGRRHAKEKE
jgi:hypothetical protein